MTSRLVAYTREYRNVLLIYLRKMARADCSDVAVHLCRKTQITNLYKYASAYRASAVTLKCFSVLDDRPPSKLVLNLVDPRSYLTDLKRAEGTGLNAGDHRGTSVLTEILWHHL